jgi:hypothetical protein
MSIRGLRALLILPLILLLAGGTLATIGSFEWLDQRRLGGIVIMALVFWAVAILGIYMQLGEDHDCNAPPARVARGCLVYTAQIGTFIALFVGGIWLLLLAVTRALSGFAPDWAVTTVFIMAFTGYIAAVLKLLGWLIDRGIVGGR